MDYLGKGEVLTNTDLDRYDMTDLWTIFERNRPFLYIEKVLDLRVQLMKNGAKTKVLHLQFSSVYIMHFLIKRNREYIFKMYISTLQIFVFFSYLDQDILQQYLIITYVIF